MIVNNELRKDRKIQVDIQGLAPSFSEEAERALLGAMIADPDEVVDRVIEAGLKPQDFFNPAHQTLFEAIRDMHMKRIAIDPVTLFQYLQDRKLADAVGGPAILGDLAAGVVSLLSMPTHLKTVKDKSLLRQLQRACAEIVLDTQEMEYDAAAVLDAAESRILAISDAGTINSTSPARSVVQGTIEIIERTCKRKGVFDGIPSGFHELDVLTTGFKPGEMIVIAARPGVGKTALALSMAQKMLKERYDDETESFVKPGYGVGFFSLEMTNQQLMLRLIASLASISMQKIRHGTVSEADLMALSNVAQEIADMPLYLDESPVLNINQLRAKARRMRYQLGVEIIFIDYLQLLTSDSAKARENRQVEVAEISRGIKSLAKELGIPIVVLAQLNRKPDETSSGEPALHHLRESGSIEQDADVVMLLHRKSSKDKDKGEEEAHPVPGQPVVAVLNVAKQRSGPTDRIELIFQGEYTRFEALPPGFKSKS